MSDFKSHTTRGITSDIFFFRWMIILTNCFSRYCRISKYFRPPWADVNRVTVTMQYLHYTIKEVETSWIISTVNTHVTWHHEPNTLTCSLFYRRFSLWWLTFRKLGLPSLGFPKDKNKVIAALISLSLSLSLTPSFAVFFLTFLLSLSHYGISFFLTGWWVLSHSPCLLRTKWREIRTTETKNTLFLLSFLSNGEFHYSMSILPVPSGI